MVWPQESVVSLNDTIITGSSKLQDMCEVIGQFCGVKALLPLSCDMDLMSPSLRVQLLPTLSHLHASVVFSDCG